MPISTLANGAKELLVLDNGFKEGLKTKSEALSKEWVLIKSKRNAALPGLIRILRMSLGFINVGCLPEDRKGTIVDNFRTAVQSANTRIDNWLAEGLKINYEYPVRKDESPAHAEREANKSAYKARIQRAKDDEQNTICRENRQCGILIAGIAQKKVGSPVGDVPTTLKLLLARTRRRFARDDATAPEKVLNQVSGHDDSRPETLELAQFFAANLPLAGRRLHGFRAMSQSSSSSGKNVDSGKLLRETQAFQDQKQPKNANLFRKLASDATKSWKDKWSKLATTKKGTKSAKTTATKMGTKCKSNYA
ncbi:hypothetical protein DFJ73DRAFT_957103 [Zopfochytrium polystomum]|nr:hypothetical protein DFJ73DRAFT_957103 [Zopfochytrium polystomum]